MKKNFLVNKNDKSIENKWQNERMRNMAKTFTKKRTSPRYSLNGSRENVKHQTHAEIKTTNNNDGVCSFDRFVIRDVDRRSVI